MRKDSVDTKSPFFKNDLYLLFNEFIVPHLSLDLLSFKR